MILQLKEKFCVVILRKKNFVSSKVLVLEIAHIWIFNSYVSNFSGPGFILPLIWFIVIKLFSCAAVSLGGGGGGGGAGALACLGRDVPTSCGALPHQPGSCCSSYHPAAALVSRRADGEVS